jgi:hypothetical protein
MTTESKSKSALEVVKGMHENGQGIMLPLGFILAGVVLCGGGPLACYWVWHIFF